MIRYNIWGEASYGGYPLTQWFPYSVKPYRKGWYVAGSAKWHSLMKWDGKKWRNSVGRAIKDQNLGWCGIAHEV